MLAKGRQVDLPVVVGLEGVVVGVDPFGLANGCVEGESGLWEEDCVPFVGQDTKDKFKGTRASRRDYNILPNDKV